MWSGPMWGTPPPFPPRSPVPSPDCSWVHVTFTSQLLLEHLASLHRFETTTWWAIDKPALNLRLLGSVPRELEVDHLLAPKQGTCSAAPLPIQQHVGPVTVMMRGTMFHDIHARLNCHTVTCSLILCLAYLAVSRLN